MNLSKILFLFVLFGSLFNVTAQTEPLQITQGYIRNTKYMNDPPQTENVWAISGDGFSTIVRSNYYQSESMPSFFSNSLVTNYLYIVAPSSQRGDATYINSTCQNCSYAHPNQPLSTRFEIKLDDFRVPKIKKSTPIGTTINVIIPFTMTGQVSPIIGSAGQALWTRRVTGTGRVRLVFKRTDNNWKRIQLNESYFGFGTLTP